MTLASNLLLQPSLPAGPSGPRVHLHCAVPGLTGIVLLGPRGGFRSRGCPIPESRDIAIGLKPGNGFK